MKNIPQICCHHTVLQNGSQNIQEMVMASHPVTVGGNLIWPVHVKCFWTAESVSAGRFNAGVTTPPGTISSANTGRLRCR